MKAYPNFRFQKRFDHYDWFELSEDCYYDSTNFPCLVIPKGYVTDFASVPRLLWPIIPPHGLMVSAAIVHDYIYDRRISEEWKGEKRARLNADMDFAINCLRAGVPFWQTAVTFTFIRIFGCKWWRK